MTRGTSALVWRDDGQNWHLREKDRFERFWKTVKEIHRYASKHTRMCPKRLGRVDRLKRSEAWSTQIKPCPKMNNDKMQSGFVSACLHAWLKTWKRKKKKKSGREPISDIACADQCAHRIFLMESAWKRNDRLNSAEKCVDQVLIRSENHHEGPRGQVQTLFIRQTFEVERRANGLRELINHFPESRGSSQHSEGLVLARSTSEKFMLNWNRQTIPVYSWTPKIPKKKTNRLHDWVVASSLYAYNVRIVWAGYLLVLAKKKLQEVTFLYKSHILSAKPPSTT